MSIRAINWASDHRVGNATAKFCLIWLANYADEEGKCFPSNAELARVMEVSERTIQTAIGYLEEHGFLTRQRDRHSDGRMGRTRYKLCLDKQGTKGESPPEKSAGGPPENDDTATGKYFRSTNHHLEPPKINNNSAGANLNVFRAAWPTTVSDKAYEVEAAWHMLTPAEQIDAINSIPAYEEAMAQIKRDVLPSGQRYLAEKLWLGIKAKGPPGAARPDDPATRAELIHQLTMTAEHSTDEQRKAKARAELDRLASSDDPEIAVLLSRRTG